MRCIHLLCDVPYATNFQDYEENKKVCLEMAQALRAGIMTMESTMKYILGL